MQAYHTHTQSGRVFQQTVRVRDAIAQPAKEMPPQERLEDVAARLGNLLGQINACQSQRFSSTEEETASKAQLLRTLDGRLRELADSTKSWSDFKKRGRQALSDELRREFEQLWRKCAGHGFFVNPCGELESTLVDYGVSWTTDKKGWIRQALTLLAGLEVNDDKHPWALIKEINNYLWTDKPSDDEAFSPSGAVGRSTVTLGAADEGTCHPRATHRT